MKKKTSFILSLGASLLATGIALTLVECGVRFYASKPKVVWTDRPLFYFHSPQNQSMQDYKYETPKPPGRYRIATIGDSFTFAPYMQFTDTYVKKLEQMLRLSGDSSNVDVINYGVPAYSTSHEIPVVKRALKDGADLLLLQITLNDPEIKHHTPSGLTENMHDRFGALKLTGPLGSVARHWKTLEFALTRIHNTKTHKAYAQYFVDLYDNPRTWKSFKRSMRNLVEITRSQNVPIRAVIFPLFGLPMDSTYPFYSIHKKVQSLMDDLGVETLDISSIYKDIPLARLQVIPGVDRHPNEIAHRMAAEKIYLWLENQNLIPAHLRIREKFATRLGINPQRRLEE